MGVLYDYFRAADVDAVGRRCRRDFPRECGDVVDTAGWAGDPVTYHQTDSRRRDFHRLKRAQPAGRPAARAGRRRARLAEGRTGQGLTGQGLTGAMMRPSYSC
jgi:hypothetical protein